MPNVIFVQPDGSECTIDIPVGHSLREGAVRNDVPGVAGECGGFCSCATCHVYLDPTWAEYVPAAEDAEQSMLDFAIARRPGSRLACQIQMTEALDNIIVHVPESQY